MRCKLNSMHNCRVAIQVGWQGARQKSKAQTKWDSEGEKKKVKITKPDAIRFLKPFGTWGSTLQKYEDSEKRDARKQNARRRSGIFWMGLYWVGQKDHSGFSVTSYGKTQTNLLTDPVRNNSTASMSNARLLQERTFSYVWSREGRRFWQWGQSPGTRQNSTVRAQEEEGPWFHRRALDWRPALWRGTRVPGWYQGSIWEKRALWGGDGACGG